MSAILTDLKQSTQGSSGSPDGNVYWDNTNRILELFDSVALANVTYTGSITATSDAGGGQVTITSNSHQVREGDAITISGTTSYNGSALTATNVTKHTFEITDTYVADETGTWTCDDTTNRLSPTNRATMAVLYAFERLRRRKDNTLRFFDEFIGGNYKRAGAYVFLDNAELRASDKAKIDASGWAELDIAGDTQAKYYGAISLANVEPTSQPYYQFASDGAPIDFQRLGPVSESVKVWEQGGADNTSYFKISVRTFGYTFSSKTLADLPYDSTDADIGGFAISEASKSVTDTFTNVQGTPIAPYAGMAYGEYDADQNRDGFSDGDNKPFTAIFDSNGATVAQVMTKLDALATVDAVMNTLTGHNAAVVYGKRTEEQYTINSNGQMLTRAGLHVDGLPANELKNIIQQDKNGVLHSYPSYPAINISVGAAAKGDPNAWYQVFYLDGAAASDFNQATAVTVKDKDGVDIEGPVGGTDISFLYAYSTNTQAGLPAGVNKDIVVLVEGDGGCTAKRTDATIKSTDISISCEPSVETNI